MRVPRSINVVAVALGVCLIFAEATKPAAAAVGFDVGGIIAYLAQILDQNHQLVAKLSENNRIAGDHLALREDLAQGFRNPIPEIKRVLTQDYKDKALGYVEDELDPMHQIMRDGRVATQNRDDYEHVFGKVPDTPNNALSQLLADDTANILLTKCGENVKLLTDLREEFDRLTAEQQAHPDRAAELTLAANRVQHKIATLEVEMNAYRGQAEAMQLALQNQYRKSQDKATLATAEELANLTRSVRPMWMRDTSENGQGGFAEQ